MSDALTVAPRAGTKTFCHFPLALDLDALDAHVAILGLPYGDPYSMEEVTNDQSNAPTAVRHTSDLAWEGLARWDFDLGGTVFDGQEIRVVDCGDVPADPRDLSAHYRLAEAAVRKILKAGTMPISIGGDHGVPIPVFRALEEVGPVHLIQIDAHLDWRDHLNGAKEGYSSPIRRAAELSHIDQIFQIGLRCQGSARTEEFEAATAYGVDLTTAYELHDDGMEAVLARIPDGEKYYLTIDADGMEPSAMPGVAAPAPGGVTYPQMHKLIHGLVKKGKVVGMDIVEITPARDVNELTCITAARMITNLIGAAVRAGYFRE
jgi:agmatinase